MSAHFGRGFLCEMARPDLVVIDEAVARLHQLPWEAPRVEIPARKDVATWQRLHDAFIHHALDRDATVGAVGGGTLLDVAGFAAATYLRGVAWQAVPTTLLAQVDAAHGGKTGIDHPEAKNLVGAFHAPDEVWCDALFLETLAEEDVRGGMAEFLKHAVIGAPDLLECTRPFEQVEQSAAVKLAIVAEDPREQGRRRLLNLGHTIGHGVEQASDYAMHHGDCVAIGLRAACAIAEQHCGFADKERVDAALDRWKLPRTADVDPDTVWAAMRHDKKRRGTIQRWVLPVALGDVRVFEDVEQGLARHAVDACCA